MQKTRNPKTLWMAQTAILSAIILVMTFTPLGYLRVGPVEITFLMIPVVIGAIAVGPGCGAVLGAVFGLSSFIQALQGSPFGFALLSINPFLTFVLCMVPRILIGVIAGYIFRALIKLDKTHIVSFGVAALSGALVNTILFVGALILFFGNSDYLRQFGETPLAIIGTLVTVNAAIEAGVCMVAGGAVAKALHAAFSKRLVPQGANKTDS